MILPVKNNNFEWNGIIATTDHDSVTKAIGIREENIKHQQRIAYLFVCTI